MYRFSTGARWRPRGLRASSIARRRIKITADATEAMWPDPSKLRTGEIVRLLLLNQRPKLNSLVKTFALKHGVAKVKVQSLAGVPVLLKLPPGFRSVYAGASIAELSISAQKL